MSFICEKIYHFKWWDYSNYLLNINGRTCLFFTVLWGILGVLLIKYINPFLLRKINELKNSTSETVLKTVISAFIVFIIFDAIITSFALKSFYNRIAYEFDLDLEPSNYQLSSELESNPLFSTSNMLITYPNMQIAGTKYDGTYVDHLYDKHRTYYFRVFAKK